jgi:nicotinate-nucleotide--dimethylbenzimidazole phosphoribosyltransferase
MEAELAALAASVNEPDAEWAESAWQRLDGLTKPPRSLGRLEQLAVQIAAAQRTVTPHVDPSAIVLCAGDHGVVAEGVSAWPSDVTHQMVANFVAGGAAINQLAGSVGARLILMDVGVNGDTSGLPGVLQVKVRPGTRNLAVEDAMTREEAAEAILVGARMARHLVSDGVRVIGIGEMGIGNSTAASALVAAYTNVPVNRVIGRGTGIDDKTLLHKTSIVSQALHRRRISKHDPLDTLASLGGLEIAAMAGVLIGGAAAGACVVTDGFISASAALAATSICPACQPYVFASHLSMEPGHRVALVALGLEPYISLEMRLGEGTGAALGIGIMQAACSMMNGMATFAEAGVSGPGPETA